MCRTKTIWKLYDREFEMFINDMNKKILSKKFDKELLREEVIKKIDSFRSIPDYSKSFSQKNQQIILAFHRKINNKEVSND